MDPHDLAAALYPYLKAMLDEEQRAACQHQYVLTGTPRRKDDAHETRYIHVFFCEHCLDVREKTQHITRDRSYWT